MPTLKWIVRPRSGTSATEGESARRSAAASAAVPNQVVSAAATAAAVPDSVQVALPAAASSKRDACADGRKKKKRKINPRAEAARDAKKKSKATSERDLPTGVRKARRGKKFESQICGGGKSRYIGTFDTPEQASAAYISVRRDLDAAKVPSRGANEVDDVFNEAKKKALMSAGGFVTRDLPRGVHKLPSGKFESTVWWGEKTRYIGRFDTLDQASATIISIRKDLDKARLSALGADEVDALFDEAKKNVLESFGIFALPRGVYKRPSGKYECRIWRGGKSRSIGTFDTPEQASAAYISVRKDLDKAKPSAFRADEIDYLFDAARTKALEAVGGIVPTKATSERHLPRGVTERSSGKFGSSIRCGGKARYIGTFGTPEQASVAYMPVRKDLDDAKVSPRGSDKDNKAVFEAAKKKALEAVMK